MGGGQAARGSGRAALASFPSQPRDPLGEAQGSPRAAGCSNLQKHVMEGGCECSVAFQWVFTLLITAAASRS